MGMIRDVDRSGPEVLELLLLQRPGVAKPTPIRLDAHGLQRLLE